MSAVLEAIDACFCKESVTAAVKVGVLYTRELAATESQIDGSALPAGQHSFSKTRTHPRR